MASRWGTMEAKWIVADAVSPRPSWPTSWGMPLGQEDEASALRLLRRHADAVEPLLAEHGGSVAKPLGDGYLAKFPCSILSLARRVATASARGPARWHAMSMETVLGQPSWKISSDVASACVTRSGGMVAPLEFDLGGRRRQVFHIAPWAEEAPDAPPILQSLRGDFFCMPFGLSVVPYQGELHPLHGETANEPWDLVAQSDSHVELELRTRIRPATVRKTLSLRRGETVLYSRHVVSGGEGPVTYGHHAMPKFPDRPGSGLLEVGNYVEGLVFPGNFEEPSLGGYTSLKPGAFFDSLSAVPCKDGTTADLTIYPARPGYEDLVMLMSDPGKRFAWSAVTFPEEGYVWFCLKDPRVLPSTMLWISNGGRHYAPWNGRHRGVMGIEEVCTGLPSGIGEAIGPNLMAERGYKTHGVLSRDQDLVVNVIVGAVAVPEGFGRVLGIEIEEGKVVVEGWGAQAPVEVPVDAGFLYGQ